MSLNDLNKAFKLPIDYDKDKIYINDELKEDLELTDTSGNDGLYKYVFNAETCFGKHIANTYSNSFTPNNKYLIDSQKFIKDFCRNDAFFSIHEKTNEVCKTWFDIKNNNNFIDKYQYVDVNVFKFLNRRADFLQFLSMFNLSSPVISLVFPIFMLILPFFIIKFRTILLHLKIILNFSKLLFKEIV